MTKLTNYLSNMIFLLSYGIKCSDTQNCRVQKRLFYLKIKLKYFQNIRTVDDMVYINV